MYLAKLVIKNFPKLKHVGLRFQASLIGANDPSRSPSRLVISLTLA
jgi:hypothetical protein